MSTDREIAAVYNDEIYKKTKIVFDKYGKSPFYENFAGFQIEGLYDGLGIENIVCSEFTPNIKKRTKCL